MASRVHHFKLVLLGDTAVGKSCLVVRFVRDEFFEFQEPTIGGKKEIYFIVVFNVLALHSDFFTSRQSDFCASRQRSETECHFQDERRWLRRRSLIASVCPLTER